MADDARARVLLFTGEGKGKTTAALGMALRACGHNLPVLIVQFCKADATTGEIAAIENLDGVEIVQTGLGWVPQPSDPQFARHREAAERGLQRVEEDVEARRHRVIVLDEVCYAVARGLLQEARVTDVIRKAAPGCCLVLTGRGATPGLIELADTVTEMRCVKHAMNEGRPAQEGVEK